ncbi:MAG: AAA family ATPase, partial [Spirochaetes bacterium]|nr:AAA family ATPase [Spirochaetota bacterium]
MKIKEIILSNFKGVNETTSVEIKPITIFIGANSSGKSTIIHSIATLAQTLKIQNNSKPLILDDEQAYVHLGRFIDVIHTKSYKDAIILGFVINNVQLPHFSKNDKGKENIELIETNVKVEFKFKCIMRTQEIVLTHGEYTIGNDKYIVERGKDDYKLTNMTTKKQIDIIASSGFIFEIEKQMINNKFLSGYFGDFINFFSMQNAIKASFNSVMYLGPFRQPPQRPYQSRGSNPIEVGSMGESAVTLLANEIIQLRTRNHISQIAKWLEILGMAENIDVNRILKSDLFDINITLKDKTKFSLADLGYGFSQVLPVLVQCSFAKKDSMLLFEQP